MLNTPVLFIPYDRPKVAQKTFFAIMEAKPNKLYVFSDGPNIKRNNSEELKINKKLLDLINWPCNVYTNYKSNNLGAAKAVAEAITWVFENEKMAIILEEDCVAAKSFFIYCDYLLNKYKDDNRICMISGNNYTEDCNATDDSYFFSKYGHIWGWATWKRVWDKYDFEMKDWPAFKATNQLFNVFTTRREQQFFSEYFNAFYKKEEKDTWDLQWVYCRIKEYGLSIVPKDNLVTNIGVQGLHSNSITHAHFIPVNKNYSISKEPDFVLCNAYYDKCHFKQWINKRQPLFYRVLNLPVRVFNKALRILRLR